MLRALLGMLPLIILCQLALASEVEWQCQWIRSCGMERGCKQLNPPIDVTSLKLQLQKQVKFQNKTYEVIAIADDGRHFQAYQRSEPIWMGGQMFRYVEWNLLKFEDGLATNRRVSFNGAEKRLYKCTK